MEFGSHGYGPASMNRLVRMAGISKGSIFKYFGTKAGLFDYVYRSILEEVKTLLRTLREGSLKEPFFLRIEKVLRAGLDFTNHHPLSSAIYYRVIYTGDGPKGSRLRHQVQSASREFIQTLIEDGIRSGELRQDLDPFRTAFFIQSVFDSYLQVHYMGSTTMAGLQRDNPPPGTETDPWISELIHLFRGGMENRNRRTET